jgi:phage shock protein C
MAKQSSIKRLVRPKQGRVLAGVCRGMANYFNIDIALVRLLWAFLMLPGGLPGIIMYIVAWIIIPEE